MRVLLSICLALWFMGGIGVAGADQFTYDPKGKCDPFIPLVQNGRLAPCRPQPPRPMLMLQGIVWDPVGESIALIDESEVKVGNTVGDYQVAEIRQDAVVLVHDGQPLVLTIPLEDRANGETR